MTDRRILTAAAWLAAALAALSVSLVPLDLGESVCGVWGCYPPAAPLLAMHLFTGVLVAAAVWAVTTWRPRLVRPLGAVLIVSAIVAGAILIGVDVTRWLGTAPDDYRRYWPRRAIYALLTASDIPLIQTLLAGVWCAARSAPRVPR